jgi:integrase
MAKQFYDFSSDHEIDAQIDFLRAPVNGEFKPVMLWDDEEEGLRLYIGARAATWQFFSQSRDHGDRKHTFRTLGRFDTGHVIGSGANPNPHAWEPRTHRAQWHMGVAEARKQARILSGKIEEGAEGTNAKAGPTFRQAFVTGFKNASGDAVEGYLPYLQRTGKAANGKSNSWAYNVERLGEQFLLPKWDTWSLIEMGKRPGAVREWYLSPEMRKHPTSANHCMRIIRACYRKAAAMDHRLPPIDPIAALGKKEWHKEKGEQKGLAGRELAAWYAAWQAIPNATHRAFHLVNLLIGARPGELGRARWRDLDTEAMEFTMPDAKEENDITVPVSREIVAAFELARTDKARPDNVGTGQDDLIFPGCLNNPTRDDIPARGHALRRTFKTIAEDYCGVPTQISEYLEGRMPEGVKGRYLLKWARKEGPAIIEAQRQISRTIMALLHGKSMSRAAAKRKAA